MVRFYGIQPSELEKLSQEEQNFLYEAIDGIRAKEMLSLVQAIALATSPGNADERKAAMKQLVLKAFEGDPVALAIHLEPLTRKRF